MISRGKVCFISQKQNFETKVRSLQKVMIILPEFNRHELKFEWKDKLGGKRLNQARFFFNGPYDEVEGCLCDPP